MGLELIMFSLAISGNKVNEESIEEVKRELEEINKDG